MGRSLPRRTVPSIGAAFDADRVLPAERLGDAGLVTAAVGAGAVAARALSIPVPCPLLGTTGVPCPGCGMTRLADGVIHGHVVDAVATDPLGAVVLAIVAALALAGLAGRVTPAPVPAAARAAPALLLAVLSLRWVAVLLGAGPAIA